LMRGLKGADYWVMETTAGPRGGGNASIMLPKGALRAAMWHDIGHGANLVSYWQWRDALNGGEQNHGAIVDVDGDPDPIYQEYAEVGREFEKAGPAINGTTVDARVAILHSYPSRWTIDWQKMNPDYDAIDALMSYYAPLHQLGYSIDIIPPDGDLTKYKLVIAPALNVLTRAEADNLARYVKHGGHLVLGQRSAMKNEYEARWPERQPGPLAALLGARVEQYTALGAPVEADGVWGHAEAKMFAEQLTPEAQDVQVLMKYNAPGSWIDGQPAAVTREVGSESISGSITYMGAWLDEQGMKRAEQWMLTKSGAQPDLFHVPAGVEVYRRVGTGRQIFIVENDGHDEQTVELPSAMNDLLTGENVQTLKLPVCGVAVLEKTDSK
jgi:beta-galactosidase